MTRSSTAVLVLLFGSPLPLARAVTLTSYRVAPADTDPAIQRYNEPHVVVFDRETATSAATTLLVVMAGTGASPAGIDDFLTLAATVGYRAIALSYNNRPPVAAVCREDPDPQCSGKFRQKRIFGDDVTTVVDDKPEESILRRLVKLLGALDKQHPVDGWGQYLDGDAPRWDRIALAGHSQGAGMAAYIAQRKHVVRVVLLSGPEDVYPGEGGQRLAPWVRDGNGATPAALWFAAYHKNESFAQPIALAYQALKVPAMNVRVLGLEPAERVGNNPYHGSVVMSRETPRNVTGGATYADDWKFLLRSPD